MKRRGENDEEADRAAVRGVRCGDEPVRGAGACQNPAEGQADLAAAARGAVLPVPVFHRRNGGDSRDDGDGERRVSGLRTGAVAAGCRRHSEKEAHAPSGCRHFDHVSGRDDDGDCGRHIVEPVACGLRRADAGGRGLCAIQRVRRSRVGLHGRGDHLRHAAFRRGVLRPAGAGRGGGARRADGAADAAGEKRGVPDGGALSGRGLFGGGVFPLQRGDCENRREQNVVVHRRIDHRFDFGRSAGAGRAAAYRADRRRGGDRGGRIHGEPSVENIKATKRKIPCTAERVPTERGIFDVLWGIS